MTDKHLCFLIALLFSGCVYGQESKFSLGFLYGIGSELKNKNYTYTNHYYKAPLNYKWKKSAFFEFEWVLQPEVNFAEHQLLNPYFVKEDEANFEQKRIEFTKLKDIHEYILNVGFLVRKPFTKHFSSYVLGSIGPMITDTETERLSKGFAFSDVIAMGVTGTKGKTNVSASANLRHESNGGLQSSNAGFNTLNFEFCVAFTL